MGKAEKIQAIKGARVSQGKRRAISLLDRVLAAHNLDEKEHNSIINEISNALNIKQGQSSDVKGDQENETAAAKQKKATKDAHNSLCDVCNKGGDLLGCDTCTLVFHTSCLRPKMDSTPKGGWSCAHCIVAGTVTSPGMSTGEARAALQAMNRLTRGIDSLDDDVRSAAKAGEITISRSGRRFVVRKTAKSQIVELDRCNTLEEALLAVIVAQNPNLSRRSHKGSADKEELWCAYCVDDPSVVLCAFCGCRRCFGKHDSDTLLVCDGCDDEWHTTCLPKPLDCVPDAAWYCGACIDSGKDDGEESIPPPSSRARTERSSNNNNRAAPPPKLIKTSAHLPNLGRGRGRPPSTNSKKSGAGDFSSPSHTLGSPIDMSARDAFDDFTANAAFAGGAAGTGSRSGTHAWNDSGDNSFGMGAGAAFSFDHDHFESDNSRFAPAAVLRAPGYEEAIDIILGYPVAAAADGGGGGAGNGDGGDVLDFDSTTTATAAAFVKGQGSRRRRHNPTPVGVGVGALRPAEKDLLAQVRAWAPLGDLEITRIALAGQCASIYKRILEFDPDFKFHGAAGLAAEQTPVDASSMLNDDDLRDVGQGLGLGLGLETVPMAMEDEDEDEDDEEEE